MKKIVNLQMLIALGERKDLTPLENKNVMNNLVLVAKLFKNYVKHQHVSIKIVEDILSFDDSPVTNKEFKKEVKKLNEFLNKAKKG